MDFGKFKFDEAKKARQARKRQTVILVKEVKLRPKTDVHDYDFKLAHVRRFLADGNKVRLIVQFRGREIVHPETGRAMLDRLCRDVAEIGQPFEPERVELVAEQQPQVGVGGGHQNRVPVVQSRALEDHLHQQLVLRRGSGRPGAGGRHLGRTRGIVSGGGRVHERLGDRPAVARQRPVQVVQALPCAPHRRLIATNASAAASRVSSISASVWTSEGTQASNCEAGGDTPAASRARHQAP